MIPFGIYELIPFVPNNNVAGLTQKRLFVTSGFSLTHSVTQTGNKNQSSIHFLGLSDETTWHNNHAEDPAGTTLNMSDIAGFNIDRVRSLTSVMLITDYVHAVLEGYQSDPSTYDLTANETIAIGQPVYVTGNNTVNLADATTTATSNAIGLAITQASANSSVVVKTEGAVSQADWTSSIGSAALVPGAVYYLDTTAGKMTTTPPSTDNEVIVKLGIALTTTKFDIEVNEVAIL